MTRIILFLSLIIPSITFAQQKHSDALDDVLEYMPYAAVFGLKAFGVESTDGWRDLALTTTSSYVMSAGMAFTLKHTIHEWRPDHSDQKSFPSGHATVAFAGATMLRHQYGQLSPWIPVAGYGLATFVAVDRATRHRHHWYDVASGAAIGVGISELTWFLSRKILKKKSVALGFEGKSIDILVTL